MGPMVLLLTVGTSPSNFVKATLQKIGSKLIGVAANSFPKFFYFTIPFSLGRSFIRIIEDYLGKIMLHPNAPIKSIVIRCGSFIIEK